MARKITPEISRQMLARRALLGRATGKPKGRLNNSTILKIQSKEGFMVAVNKNLGRVANNLLKSSDMLDTSASKELLDRAFGKAPQSVAITTVQFSLSELQKFREQERARVAVPVVNKDSVVEQNKTIDSTT